MKETFAKASISVELAEHMITEAIAAASRFDKAFSVAVVDDSGILKAFRRMDNAPLISVQTSQDKAYSALMASRPTHAWQEMFDAEPILGLGVPAGVDRAIVFGGGYPIVIEGRLVGGIGASGGHFREDMEISQAGLRSVTGSE